MVPAAPGTDTIVIERVLAGLLPHELLAVTLNVPALVGVRVQLVPIPTGGPPVPL